MDYEKLFNMAWLFYQNANAAWIALPSEVKLIITATLVIYLVIALAKKAWKLVKLGLLVTVVYFALTFFGLI